MCGNLSVPHLSPLLAEGAAVGLGVGLAGITFGLAGVLVASGAKGWLPELPTTVIPLGVFSGLYGGRYDRLHRAQV